MNEKQSNQSEKHTGKEQGMCHLPELRLGYRPRSSPPVLHTEDEPLQKSPQEIGQQLLLAGAMTLGSILCPDAPTVCQLVAGTLFLVGHSPGLLSISRSAPLTTPDSGCGHERSRRDYQ